MGRHRFEDQFKAGLEKREIKPTEGSWGKLASRLETEEKRSLPLSWWIGIAATVVGAIFITGMVYNNDPVSNTPVIVETPSEEENYQETPQVQIIENEPSERMASEDIKPEEVTPANTEKTPSAKPENNTLLEKDNLNPVQLAKNSENIFEVKESQIAVGGHEKIELQAEESNFLELQLAEETVFAAEIKDILERIAEKEVQKGTVTDAELNALLTEAASQITRKRNIEKADGKIDATALLWDVEMEMEHSFREKVFEVLKEGYLKAKSAVANRNY